MIATALQIGDSEEVMYLAAKSNDLMAAWMQAFKEGTPEYFS